MPWRWMSASVSVLEKRCGTELQGRTLFTVDPCEKQCVLCMLCSLCWFCSKQTSVPLLLVGSHLSQCRREPELAKSCPNVRLVSKLKIKWTPIKLRGIMTFYLQFSNWYYIGVPPPNYWSIYSRIDFQFAFSDFSIISWLQYLKLSLALLMIILHYSQIYATKW